MGILMRPACWLMGHSWGKWYRLGRVWRRDCDFCDDHETQP